MTTSLKALCLGLLSLTFLPTNPLTAAESSTPVIGYYKFDAQPGLTLWSNGFITKTEWQGSAVSITPSAATSTIAVAGSPFTANQFNGTNGKFYVEILNAGQNSGLILDITSTTTSSVAVNGDLTGLPGTSTIAIRRHATIGTVFSSAGLVAGQDTISLIDPLGNQIDYMPNGSPTPGEQWDNLSVGGLGDADVLRPGQGFLLGNNSGAPAQFTLGGGIVSYVKSTPTKIELAPDVPNLVGLINPLVATQPADQLFLAAERPVADWFDNSVLGGFASGANIIDVFSNDGNLSVTGSFQQTGLTFYDFLGGSGLPANENLPIRNGQAVIISNAIGETIDYTIPVLHTQP